MDLENIDGKYMKIIIGDKSGELAFYGVMGKIYWEDKSVGEPYISFYTDLEHPHNGVEGKYPAAVMTPLKNLITYELLLCGTTYGRMLLSMVAGTLKPSSAFSDNLVNIKTVYSKRIGESYDKLEEE